MCQFTGDGTGTVNTRLLDLAFRPVPFRMLYPVQVDVADVVVDAAVVAAAVDLRARLYRFRTAVVALMASIDRMLELSEIANSKPCSPCRCWCRCLYLYC
jgi:hypothetical protein